MPNDKRIHKIKDIYLLRNEITEKGLTYTNTYCGLDAPEIFGGKVTKEWKKVNCLNCMKARKKELRSNQFYISDNVRDEIINKLISNMCTTNDRAMEIAGR